MSPADWQVLTLQGGMRVALALIILFLALTFAGWVASTVRASLTRLKFDATLSKFLAKLAWWGVVAVAGVCCLSYFGVETTSFAALLGAAGFAIGLAFQGTLSNFAAGAMLLIFRPFRVGDTVNVGGQLGTVDEIELFTTTLDTFDNRRIILPNSSVFGSTIENVTHHRVRRADIAVGVVYSADIDLTRATLETALEATPGVLHEPKPAVVLVQLGASSVDWSVRGWAPTTDFLTVKQALIRSVKNHLDRAGIGIPFPQMEIHLQTPAQESMRRVA
ncbi:mechanosensitive ion channel family protein [Botrimarina hoheduenensis]|nr:mechanosensitive ion channel domain-containing protein [Botrimarina hoheduenensis]